MRVIHICHGALMLAVHLIRIAYVSVVHPVVQPVANFALRMFNEITPAADVRLLIPRVKLVAFKVIKPLKRIYRESYKTHGLSISDGPLLA